MDVDQKIWQGYYNTILEWTGLGTAGQAGNAAIFASTSVTRSPIAGLGIPIAYTNAAVHNVADRLLDDSGIFYSPLSNRSYCDAVWNWMNHVLARGTNLTEEEEKVLKEATKESATAINAYLKAKTRYQKLFSQDQEAKAAGWTFIQWCQANAPNLMAIQNASAAASGKQDQINLTIFGPDAVPIAAKRNLLTVAHGIVETPGQCMKSELNYVQSFDSKKYYEALRAGQTPAPVADPTNVAYLPWYSLDASYRITMDEWGALAADAPFVFTKTFTSEMTDTRTWATYGHSETSASASVGFWGIFSFKTSGGTNASWRKQETITQTGKISVTLSARDAKIFNINPGLWNVPGFQTLYPKVTYPDTANGEPPDYLKHTVQPQALLLAAGVKLEMKVEGQYGVEFDSNYNQAWNAGGRLNIFGFDCGVGAGGGSSSGQDTHTSHWDKNTGTLSMLPTDDAGTATVLAVIGARMEGVQNIPT